MSSAQVGAVLGYIRTLAADRSDLDLPDHQLLERFALHRDQHAFAALLRRHGSMVLGVCQSVLHNLHDAEDAFQATFLMLARKAGSIHRREAVSGWLHRVAYHLAVDAQATAARRRVLEKRAATLSPADPVLDLSLRELRSVLNEELSELPEKYRAPLVLCYLESKTREEAARLLGWTRGAVKSGLERGRERLRARLRRRGLELSAGLLAAALSARTVSAQVPAALATVTLKAARWLAAGEDLGAGVVSAEVAALVQGASKTMLTSQAKIVTAWILAVGVAATALGVARLGASATDPPVLEQSQAARLPDGREKSASFSRPQPEASEIVEVSGRVLDPDGKPFSGAKLYLATHTATEVHVEQRATSGADGRFRFPVGRSELARPEAAERGEHARVLASTQGYGPDWVALDGSGPVNALTLRLVNDVPINGRILDPEGRPVAGAKITLTDVFAPRGDDLTDRIAGARKGHGIEFARHWAGPLAGQPAVLTTGADGRFRLAGAGRERIVRFYVQGPAIASVDLDVMTRATDKIVARPGKPFGASFDYVAVASRPLRGVVRDKDTGKPLAGVMVRAWTNPRCQALTDKDGRYELRGMAKAPSYWLAVKPADGLYFQRQAGVEDTPGLGALTSDIEMVRGLVVRGKVTDKEGRPGRPVAQARVEYYPLYPNATVNAQLPGRWVPRATTVTGPDGSYALTVLPGPGVIGVAGPRPETYMPALVTRKERQDFFKGTIVDPPHEMLLYQDGGGNLRGVIQQDNFNALVLLNPSATEQALVKDVTLEPGHVVKGRVIGPDGRPVTGVTVFGLVHVFGKETLNGADFTVRLNPRATSRPLLFYHREKNLGFFVRGMRSDTAGPLTIKLQPCGSASGRAVDPDGQPVAGLRVQVTGRALNNLAESPAIVTDKNGRFRVEGLVPGVPYEVLTVKVGRGLASWTVEPGQHKDLGDIKVRNQ